MRASCSALRRPEDSAERSRAPAARCCCGVMAVGSCTGIEGRRSAGPAGSRAAQTAWPDRDQPGNSMCAMTRSHPARHHAGQAPAAGQAIWLGRAVARQLRAGVAVAAAGLCAVLPALAERANAQPAAQAPQATRATRAVAAQAATAATAATGRSVTAPLAVTVTSVSPSYVQEGHAVTISGLVRNLSGATASGLSVGLLASATPLRSRLALANFAAGTETLPQTLVSIRNPTMQTLGAGRSWRWRVSLPASSLGLSCFGVYPLTAKVTAAALQAASDPVPLPYWPAKPTSCAGQTRPRPFPISWIWPLIDAPHQDACAGLTDDRLAGSIAPKGRLGYLLAIGARYAASAELTWAIDPALLDSVRAMKQPYPVGAPATCTRPARTPRAGSPACGRRPPGIRCSSRRTRTSTWRRWSGAATPPTSAARWPRAIRPRTRSWGGASFPPPSRPAAGTCPPSRGRQAGPPAAACSTTSPTPRRRT